MREKCICKHTEAHATCGREQQRGLHCQKGALSATGLQKSTFLLLFYCSCRKAGPCMMFNMWPGSIRFIENVHFLKIKESLVSFVKSLPSLCNLQPKNHFFFFFFNEEEPLQGAVSDPGMSNALLSVALFFFFSLPFCF